jgi:hypothetical protein
MGARGPWAEVTPLTALVAAMTSALGQRGGPDLTARLAARAFDRAFGRWIEPLSQQALTGLAREELQFSLVSGGGEAGRWVGCLSAGLALAWQLSFNCFISAEISPTGSRRPVFIT